VNEGFVASGDDVVNHKGPAYDVGRGTT